MSSLVKNGRIECLDISRTGLGTDITCMKSLGELISSNTNLRALGLQGLNMNDAAAQWLIDPLANTLNVEAVNLNHNRIGSGFVV